MASLTWFVIVFLCVKIVFAIGESCDECLRSGDRWCHKKAINHDGHCFSKNVENVCDSQDLEPIPTFFNTTGDEGPIKPRYTEMTIYITDPSRDQRITTIKYSSSLTLGEITYYPDVVKGVRVFDKFDKQNSCEGSECTLSLAVTVIPNFCTAFDFTEINMKIKFDGSNDEATVKYRVACYCECSHKMEVNAKRCNFNGNYTCGVCSCNSEWSGEYCEKDCRPRGDLTLEEDCLFKKNNESLLCAGNGHCDCGSCVCNENKGSALYLNPLEHCADVCSLTIACHACLRNNTPGPCSQCEHSDFVVMKYDAILAESRDLLNRTLWMQCMETVDDCTFNYRATREEDSFRVMINSTCNDIEGFVGHTSAGSKVPLILGILAMLLLVLAGGGLLLWRHMNAIPTLPMIDPQYENIEAEDCRGENPIYKPPTSSFKNPTYGKW